MEIYNKQKNTKINNLFLKIVELYFDNKLPLINGIITKEKYIKINIKENKITSFIENDFDESISYCQKTVALLMFSIKLNIKILFYIVEKEVMAGMVS
jgi:hypothetical protein